MAASIAQRRATIGSKPRVRNAVRSEALIELLHENNEVNVQREEPGAQFDDIELRLPLSTFERPGGDSTHLQTLCLWWTIDLLSLLNQAPEVKLRSLQCVCPHRSANLHWQIRDVTKVWQGLEPSSQQREPFFEDNQGAYFSAFHPDFADEFFTDREVLIELPQPNRRARKRRRAVSPRQ